MAQSHLNTAVRTRIDEKKLIQMTNGESSATSIKDIVLEAACSDAMAVFLRITGYIYDPANIIHVQICVSGVLCFLESYKSRDSAIMSMNMKNFYSACDKFRRTAYITPATPLEYNLQTQPNPPKMFDSDKRKTQYTPFSRALETNDQSN